MGSFDPVWTTGWEGLGTRCYRQGKGKGKLGRGSGVIIFAGKKKDKRKMKETTVFAGSPLAAHSLTFLFLSAFGSQGLLFLVINKKIRIQTSNNTAVLFWPEN
jgi:hypothetical protein